jgi:hypothetical protein
MSEFANLEFIRPASFSFTSWQGLQNIKNPIENFDAIKLLNFSWRTPSTGNNTMNIVITSNDDFNQGVDTTPSGDVSNYFYKTVLDPKSDVGFFYENLNPPYMLPSRIPKLTQFRYELLINGATNDPDISPSDPVLVELGFYRRIPK